MSEEVQKKSGITFSYDKSEENQTKIVAYADDKELPIILAIVRKTDTTWLIGVTDITNDKHILDAVCSRGRSFAEKLAREIIRGCFSRLGKHRRMTANKAKRDEVKND